jgi:hypothetical protein
MNIWRAMRAVLNNGVRREILLRLGNGAELCERDIIAGAPWRWFVLRVLDVSVHAGFVTTVPRKPMADDPNERKGYRITDAGRRELARLGGEP